MILETLKLVRDALVFIRKRGNVNVPTGQGSILHMRISHLFHIFSHLLEVRGGFHILFTHVAGGSRGDFTFGSHMLLTFCYAREHCI